MRHRDAETPAAKTAGHSVSGTLAKFGDLLSDQDPRTVGSHQAKTGQQPVIPTQMVPTHETVTDPVEVDEAPVVAVTESDESTGSVEPAGTAEPAPADLLAPEAVPTTAQWKAGHGARAFAACLLLLAVAGTSALGLRYADSRGTDEFVSVVIGVGVVVALWALLIASTPQVVSLRGSMITIRNSSGSERFDLADGLQPVDVVGEPRSSHWAVLLHRPNNTSVVLRRRDVDAVKLDPIVRHYRALAAQRYTDRQVRFSR